MAIQKSITQPSGVVTEFHVITAINVNVSANSAYVHLDSFVSSDSYVAGNLAVTGSNEDMSALLGVTPSATLPTIGAQTVDAVEKYLLTTDKFSGGTQVD